jgi:hypothetical protein
MIHSFPCRRGRSPDAGTAVEGRRTGGPGLIIELGKGRGKEFIQGKLQTAVSGRR